MLDIAHVLHYSSIAIITIFSSIGSGIGGQHASTASIEALNVQPRAKNEIIRTLLIGLALVETASILALILVIIIITNATVTLPAALAETGMALAISICSLVVGIVSSFPVASSCLSIARQPFFAQKILNIMLITMSIIQTAIIFAFLIGLLITLQFTQITTIFHGLTMCASALAIGVGSIGPTIGLATFAKTACKTVSVNRKSYGQLLPFVFMSEAIIETPLIFAFLVALIIVLSPLKVVNGLILVKMLASGLCIGIGTLAPGISSSRTASSACIELIKNPSMYSQLSQASMFSQGLIDAAAVYALLISLFILFM